MAQVNWKPTGGRAILRRRKVESTLHLVNSGFDGTAEVVSISAGATSYGVDVGDVVALPEPLLCYEIPGEEDLVAVKVKHISVVKL